MTKLCELIIDPFDLDINNKKLQSALYEKLEMEINSSERLFSWNNLCSTMEREIESFLDCMEYHIAYSNNITIKDFLKLMKVHFEEEGIDFFEKLLDYMRLEQEILKVKLFVLVNIKGFLSLEQLDFLYQQSCYEKIQLLMIENHLNDEKRIGGENLIIIDDDGCVIY